MTAEAVLEQMVCPECRAEVLFAPGFVAWCPACGWNVDPNPPPKLTWRDRRAAEASARASRKLYERIVTRGIKGPPPRSALINVIAAVVHLLTAIVFAGGVLISGRGIRDPFAGADLPRGVPYRSGVPGTAVLAPQQEQAIKADEAF